MEDILLKNGWFYTDKMANKLSYVKKFSSVDSVVINIVRELDDAFNVSICFKRFDRAINLDTTLVFYNDYSDFKRKVNELYLNSIREVFVKEIL